MTKRSSTFATMPALAGLAGFLLALTLPAKAIADPDNWQRAGFRTDFSRASVSFDEIIAGGPPKDGIPSIDDPVFVPVGEADRFEDREPVIEIPLPGLEGRAYPLSVLMWHEIVNDTVDGRPLAVTYCPLCNSAVVFDRVIAGEPVTFGTTGLLRNSDLVMYDRATETWWQQFTGEAIVGTHTGARLEMVPSRTVSFADFRARHPDGEVLVPNDWSMRQYGRNPYAGYEGRAGPYPLYRGDLPAELEPMERVVVIRRDGDVVAAVALSHLRQAGHLAVADTEILWEAGVASALDTGTIAQGRDVGAITVTDAATGTPLVHDITFAFVVKAFHPDERILTKDGWISLSAR